MAVYYWNLVLLVFAYLACTVHTRGIVRLGLAFRRESAFNLTSTVLHYFETSRKFHNNVDLDIEILPVEIFEEKTSSDWLLDAEVVLSQNLSAIIGTYSPELEQIVAGQLPYITTDPEFYDIVRMRRKYSSLSREIERHRADDVISLLPVLAAMFEPMKQFVYERVEADRGRKHNDTVVIVENIDDYNVFVGNQLFSRPNNLVSPFTIPKDATVNETRIALAEARKVGSSLIFVHSQDIQFIQKIIESAMSLDMMTYLYDWVLTYADMDGLAASLGPSLLSNCSSVTGFQLVDRSVFVERGLPPPPDGNSLEHALLFDAVDIVVKSVLNGPLDTSSSRLWDSLRSFPADNTGAIGPYGPVLQVDGKEETRLNSMNRVFIRPSVTVDWKEYRSCQYEQIHHSVYELQISLEVDEKKEKKTKLVLPEILPSNATDRSQMPFFNRLPVKVALDLAPPFVFEETSLEGEKVYKGLMIDYLNIYADALNFSFVYECVDNDAGSFSGGVWSGSIGHLVREEVSLAVGGVSMSTQRSEYVDFTETTFPGTLSTLMKRPEIPSTAWQFLYPFSWVMWTSILVVFLIVSGLLCVMDRVDYTDDNFTTRDSFYYVASLLLSGSTDTNPQSFPSRILIGCFIFFSIVVFQSYVANMAAFLTTRDDFEDIPQSVHDLISQNSMQLAALGEASVIISQSKKEPLLGLSNKLIGEQLHYENHEEAISGLRNGSFGEQALILVSSTTQYYATQYCDVMYLHHGVDPILYALALPKGSQMKRVFDTVITNVRELGKDLTITERWYRPNEKCESSGAEGYSANLETKSLSFVEMIGVFIVILIGVGVATFVGVLGEFWRRLPDSRRQKITELGI